ncbi:PDZ domain-containing protein 4 isoform X2 [Calonectris borealis]|uniref:PDZ domain-containing protein 4 isoform X2 n=1 Tax=Calonectris borealis TaxID=1323832 RepID=UPI003F4C9DEC
MGCNMCVVQKPEEQHRVMLQVSGKEGPRRGPGPGPGPEPGRGGPRGPKEPLVLQVLRRSPRGRPPAGGGPPPGAAAPPHPRGGPGPPPAAGLVDSGTQTDISFESRLGPGRGAGSPGGAEPPPLPHDYFDPADLGEPERPEELEYEEVELYKASHRDKLGLTVCYRTDGEEDAGIYVGEVNPNSIAAKDGRIREGDRIIQRWKDSDREDFLDDFGSDEEGELRQRGPWTPPGQPPSPATPCPRGAEPDSGVGRTDESTRNEESSEHDLLGDEGGEGPPLRPPPPRRGPPSAPRPAAGRPGPGAAPGASPRGRAGAAGRPGAGSAAGSGPSPGGRPGSGSSSGSGAGPAGCGSGGRAGAGAGAAAAAPGSGFGPGGRPGPAPAGRAGAGCAPPPAARAAAAPGPGPGPSAAAAAAAVPGLSQAELRRYRQLRGRLGAAAAGRAELALLEEELRHLEFKCRHLLRAQKMERLRERCLRAWLEAAGAEPPLADISEAPERDSTSAYNTGESCRSSPLLRGLAGPPAGGKGPRGKRPGRDRLLKARAIKILEERGGSTTDDDARSELKTGRYWSREQRKQHLARAREQRRRRELLLLQGRAEAAGGGPAAAAAAGGGPEPPPLPPAGAGTRRGLRKRSRRILDNWATIQEMLARGARAADGGRLYNPLLSVTTV